MSQKTVGPRFFGHAGNPRFPEMLLWLPLVLNPVFFNNPLTGHVRAVAELRAESMEKRPIRAKRANLMRPIAVPKSPSDKRKRLATQCCYQTRGIEADRP